MVFGLVTLGFVFFFLAIWAARKLGQRFGRKQVVPATCLPELTLVLNAVLIGATITTLVVVGSEHWLAVPLLAVTVLIIPLSILAMAFRRGMEDTTHHRTKKKEHIRLVA